ncbi:glycoside hydrolase domain-containing protein [Pedobacter sp. ASV1-7]|uniref:glycoside hydrolase domain-containing protein n=1 Tax=Pedobacter sp. ASV1-7 TaxID=3145237 RepID=UPI0032E8785D
MKKIITLCCITLLATNIKAQKNADQPRTLVVKEKSISMPGKQIDLNTDGLPAMISTSLNLVTEPIHFHIINAADHKDIRWNNGILHFKKQSPEKVSWIVKNTSDALSMDIEGVIKPDGELNYTVKIKALNDINLENIRLHLPFTPETAKIVKGLGRKEETWPEIVDWKWNTAMEGLWIGNAYGGLQYVLTDKKHKILPTSWSNNGNGGIHVEQKGKAILADNYSAEQHMKKGDVLYYNFNMLITSDAIPN